MTSVTARGTVAMPRSRGAITGVAIVVLGVWGGLIPFLGPYFNYEFGSDQALQFTIQRLWLDILPAVAAIVGGVILIRAANRPGAALGAWLALAGGIWFVVGVPLSRLWDATGPGGIGQPLGGHVRSAVEQVGYFYGLGGVITALAAFALGRLTVRSARDLRVAEEHHAERRATEPADTSST